MAADDGLLRRCSPLSDQPPGQWTLPILLYSRGRCDKRLVCSVRISTKHQRVDQRVHTLSFRTSDGTPPCPLLDGPASSGAVCPWRPALPPSHLLVSSRCLGTTHLLPRAMRPPPPPTPPSCVHLAFLRIHTQPGGPGTAKPGSPPLCPAPTAA